jgi:hypothetical protein
LPPKRIFRRGTTGVCGAPGSRFFRPRFSNDWIDGIEMGSD